MRFLTLLARFSGMSWSSVSTGSWSCKFSFSDDFGGVESSLATSFFFSGFLAQTVELTSTSFNADIWRLALGREIGVFGILNTFSTCSTGRLLALDEVLGTAAGGVGTDGDGVGTDGDGGGTSAFDCRTCLCGDPPLLAAASPELGCGCSGNDLIRSTVSAIKIACSIVINFISLPSLFVCKKITSWHFLPLTDISFLLRSRSLAFIASFSSKSRLTSRFRFWRSCTTSKIQMNKSSLEQI